MQVERLLRHDAPTSWLLAAQLLPADGKRRLKREVSAKITPLIATGTSAQRQVAMAALGRLGMRDTTSATALITGLTDADWTARRQACFALARSGQKDKRTIEALLDVYRTDSKDAVRHAALEALLALGQAEKVGMVMIPAGEFLMGSSDHDRQADSDEKPQHRVYLPDYFIDRTPVTNAQYRQFIDAEGYQNADYWAEAIAANRWKNGKIRDWAEERSQPYYWDSDKWNQDQQPVVGVTWYEAVAYARWAGKRLPSEAEWEKAARGTDGRLYPWGNEQDAKRANTEEGGRNVTTPVGLYSPAGDSPYGVVDMVGNVFEWCSTKWGTNYPYTPDDGREELDGSNNIRILRGGSWRHNQNKWSRCGSRNRYFPIDWDSDFGIRCMCTTSSLAGSGS